MAKTSCHQRHTHLGKDAPGTNTCIILHLGVWMVQTMDRFSALVNHNQRRWVQTSPEGANAAVNIFNSGTGSNVSSPSAITRS